MIRCKLILIKRILVLLTYFVFFLGLPIKGFCSSASNTLTVSNVVKQEVNITVHDSVVKFKELAKTHADSLQASGAIHYAKKYIRATQDLSIINDHFFESINQTDAYLNFKSRYKPEFNMLSIFYLFAGFLGLFVFLLLNFKKGVDRMSTFLISLFVLLHSFFILHLSLYLINCHYYFPNTLLFSTVFTLLYGPLIFFYFKMIVTDYKLKWMDLLHLIPALVLLVYIMPFYGLSSQEKFVILFDQSDILLSQANVIIAANILSLLVYMIFTIRLYGQAKKTVNQKNRRLLWQRNIIAMYVLYVVTYILYITVTSGYLDNPIFFHFQILVMVGLVFYVAYISYVQPEIFKGKVKLIDPIGIFKYKKSGLTKNFSKELKQNLVHLLDEEKVYRRNDMNLDILSELLETNRHNTSQVINEHFDMNFFELMNKFRIEEAVRLIHGDSENKLNIIDIAYEVGYNNKVTFNKAFKKIHEVTPSQYIKSLKTKKKTNET